MAIETWKVLVGLAVVFVTFGVVVTTSGQALSLPLAVFGLVTSVLVVGVCYVLIKKGYTMGKQAGTRMQDKKS